MRGEPQHPGAESYCSSGPDVDVEHYEYSSFSVESSFEGRIIVPIVDEGDEDMVDQALSATALYGGDEQQGGNCDVLSGAVVHGDGAVMIGDMFIPDDGGSGRAGVRRAGGASAVEEEEEEHSVGRASTGGRSSDLPGEWGWP